MEKISKPRRLRAGQEAEMGVGTLLIFIAMILVAAVAAGVLVQTAYMLQQQAETTGDQALMEISTGLKTLAAFGVTDANLTTITDLYLKIELAAGSPVINLYDLVIEMSTGMVDISYVYTNLTAGVGTFNVTQIRDTYPSNIWTATDVGITQGDIALVHIDLDANGMGLVTQQEANLLLIPKHGIPTYLDVVTPSVYSNVYEILT
ncbi:TPA: flagellin [Thermoplasmata archaeon]|nr:flagellin [Thermoplasmata archaeon]